MTGEDLRAIRRVNNITQYELSALVGYSTPYTLRKVESSLIVSIKFIEAISKRIKVDLTDSHILERYLELIPDSYYY